MDDPGLAFEKSSTQLHDLEVEIRAMREKYKFDFCTSLSTDERENVMNWCKNKVNEINQRIFAFNSSASGWRVRLNPLDVRRELAGVLPGSLGGKALTERD